MKEREERRRNIIAKGLEIKEGRRRDAVIEVMKRVGVEIEIEEIRRVGGGTEEGGDGVSQASEGGTEKGINEEKRDSKGKKRENK